MHERMAADNLLHANLCEIGSKLYIATTTGLQTTNVISFLYLKLPKLQQRRILFHFLTKPNLLQLLQLPFVPLRDCFLGTGKV